MTSPGIETLAELTVLSSDDPSRIGNKVKIAKTSFTIGRSTTNDLSFSNDHPVSRRHAQIDYKNGQFLLSEIVTETNGSTKPPTYGTFLNDDRLANGSVKLHSGDEIRLGNRLKLRFIHISDQKPEGEYESETIDELNDATID